ncbi:hypothetical protein B0H14DRAFT_2834941 [Mycena olivaceomarginata]|nr:hypothetical protein B0H14DRAFT_2834941 [Mycena olivaceomarginata]
MQDETTRKRMEAERALVDFDEKMKKAMTDRRAEKAEDKAEDAQRALREMQGRAEKAEDAQRALREMQDKSTRKRMEAKRALVDAEKVKNAMADRRAERLRLEPVYVEMASKTQKARATKKADIANGLDTEPTGWKVEQAIGTPFSAEEHIAIDRFQERRQQLQEMDAVYAAASDLERRRYGSQAPPCRTLPSEDQTFLETGDTVLLAPLLAVSHAIPMPPVQVDPEAEAPLLPPLMRHTTSYFGQRVPSSSSQPNEESIMQTETDWAMPTAVLSSLPENLKFMDDAEARETFAQAVSLVHRLYAGLQEQLEDRKVQEAIAEVAEKIFAYLLHMAHQFDASAARPKNVGNHTSVRYRFSLDAIAHALGFVWHTQGRGPLSQALLEMFHVFSLALAATELLERGWLLIGSINVAVDRLHAQLAIAVDVDPVTQAETIDTVGGLMNDSLQTAVLWAKGGTKVQSNEISWAQGIADPEGFYHQWQRPPGSEPELKRCQPLPTCDISHCPYGSLNLGRPDEGRLRYYDVSVESKKARVPPPAGGLRASLAAGGLLMTYDCPWTYFYFCPHPDLVIVWRFYGRLTHFPCKSRRGHPLVLRI